MSYTIHVAMDQTQHMLWKAFTLHGYNEICSGNLHLMLGGGNELMVDFAGLWRFAHWFSVNLPCAHRFMCETTLLELSCAGLYYCESITFCLVSKGLGRKTGKGTCLRLRIGIFFSLVILRELLCEELKWLFAGMMSLLTVSWTWASINKLDSLQKNLSWMCHFA